MGVSIQDILAFLEMIAPQRLAESWDNVGLLIGQPDHEVRSLLVGLDPSLQLLDEAVDLGCDLIITHHPIIFRPLKTIRTDYFPGVFIEKALKNRISVIASHTNLDVAENGVNDVLASLLGLTDVKPLLPGPEEGGTGRIGVYAPPLTNKQFSKRLLEILGLPTVIMAGTMPALISRVALCGGSGSEFADDARRQGADLYLSAEIKHSTARWAQDSDFCVIDGTHYATEAPLVAMVADRLTQHAIARQWPLQINRTRRETPPFTYIQQPL